MVLFFRTREEKLEEQRKMYERCRHNYDRVGNHTVSPTRSVNEFKCKNCGHTYEDLLTTKAFGT